MRRFVLAGVVGLSLAAATGARAADLADRLEGTWYVLVHYRDASSAHPERTHWEDRVWVFEREASGLRWTDYPIVVFEDKSGRFAGVGNRLHRVLGAFEPNAAQRAEIRRGLQVNPRGKRSKRLLPAAAGRLESKAAPLAPSASVITFTEHWSIAPGPGGPVFAWEDFLGSVRAEGMEGRTEFRTEAVKEGGALLEGSYERDGVRHGRFRMMRAGPVRGVPLRRSHRFPSVWATLGTQLAQRLNEDRKLVAQLRAAPPGSAERERLRPEVTGRVRAEVEATLRVQGADLAASRGEIESVTRQVVVFLVDEGHSLEELGEAFRQGRIRP